MAPRRVGFYYRNYLPQLRSSISGAVLLGSNAATMAVAVATTTLAPDFRF